MDKIELEILGISYSQTQTGAYALVLAEKNGNRRLPIIIGASEAQAIAIQLEGLTPLRPLTHDLFTNLASTFAISVVEVKVTKLEEGIFYSELVCERGGKTVNIDSRTSDAVALALRFRCPIYTNELILEKAGIVLEEDTLKKQPAKKTPKSEDLTKKETDELHDMLRQAIEMEDYENASKIRDEIKKREENK